ncbi:MAG TPA: inorganic diphosphatase [Symbiobacteriaceae bacterium]|nr:inorganic diphosphatase [Symbiobacteriaceae bacterium]
MDTGLVEVFVEIPLGGGVRHRHKPRGESPIEAFPGTDVVPALALVAYGCIPGTLNPADGSALDAYVLGAEGIAAGSSVSCKIIGIRLRNNGDHKVLTVAAGHSLRTVDDVGQLPPAVLETLALWDETRLRPGERWGSAEEGRTWISRCWI